MHSNYTVFVSFLRKALVVASITLLIIAVSLFQVLSFLVCSTWDSGICFSLLGCTAVRRTHHRACFQNAMSWPSVFAFMSSMHDKHTFFVTATALHSTGGFVPLHGGSLRSFAWAVSLARASF